MPRNRPRILRRPETVAALRVESSTPHGSDTISGPSVSVGGAPIPAHHTDLPTLLQLADTALYDAKRAARHPPCRRRAPDLVPGPDDTLASHLLGEVAACRYAISSAAFSGSLRPVVYKIGNGPVEHHPVGGDRCRYAGPVRVGDRRSTLDPDDEYGCPLPAHRAPTDPAPGADEPGRARAAAGPRPLRAGPARRGRGGAIVDAAADGLREARARALTQLRADTE